MQGPVKSTGSLRDLRVKGLVFQNCCSVFSSDFSHAISFPAFWYRLNFVNARITIVSPYSLHKAVKVPFCWLLLCSCYKKQ